MNPVYPIDMQSLVQKENWTLEERGTLSQFATNLLSQAAPVNDPSLTELAHRVKRGLQIFKITEEELLTTYDFWGCLREQGVKKLIIETKEGPIAYNEFVLQGLQVLKPELEELIEKITLRFLDGRLVETKAMLRLCGDLFQEQFAGVDISQISLYCSKDSFLSVIRAVKLEYYFGTYFPKVTLGFRENDSSTVIRKMTDITKYLLFPPQAILVSHSHIFGQDHFEKFWGKIDPVPTPPKELFAFLNEPCLILKGSRKVTTHKVFWIPKTVDGQPLTINRILNIAISDKFGPNKLERQKSYGHQIKKQIGDLPIEGGCFIAVGPPLKETTREALYFDEKSKILKNKYGYKVTSVVHALISGLTRFYPEEKCKILKDKYPGYEVMSVGHALISCLAPFASSGEITLPGDKFNEAVTLCSETIINTGPVYVGMLTRSHGIDMTTNPQMDCSVSIVPARKFYAT